jgi:hypothetical protein
MAFRAKSSCGSELALLTPEDDSIRALPKTDMSFVHHPAFQSLVLPFVLAVVGMALLRALPGRAGGRWWPLGAVLGLLAALAVFPGFDWPATSRAEKLPWIVLAGLALAALSMAWRAETSRGGRWATWLGGVLGWAGASVWLEGARTEPLQAGPFVLAGAAVLALLALGTRPAAALPRDASVARPAPAPTPSDGGTTAIAALTVAALGLGALAGSGGSLLLAQLALMLGAAAAVPGLWMWLRPASGLVVPAAVLMPLGLAWLSIAQSLPARGAGSAVSLTLVALAFAVPPLMKRSVWAARHPRWAPLAAVAFAAMPVALALIWQLIDGGSPVSAPGTVIDDDPYYAPR